MSNENTSREYGRVSALEIGEWNEVSLKIDYYYLPQVEIIEYRHDNGKTISQKFMCLSCDNRNVRLDKEIEALQYAISSRNEMKGELIN